MPPNAAAMPKKHKPISTSSMATTKATNKSKANFKASSAKKSQATAGKDKDKNNGKENDTVKSSSKKVTSANANTKTKAAPVSSLALVVVDENQPSSPKKVISPKKKPESSSRVSPQTKATPPIVKTERKVREEADEDNKTKDPNHRRKVFICASVLCCLLILLILGLVLGLVVFNNDNNNGNGNTNSNSRDGGGGQQSDSNNQGNNGSSPNGGGPPTIPNFPTQAPIPLPPSARVPTSAPVIPTSAPATAPPVPTTPTPILPPVETPTSLLQPSPSQLVIIPFADTYVQRDGFRPFEAYGEEDTFLVQNGPAAVNEIPDVIGLLGFDTSSLPASFTQVILQLYHQPAVRERGAATLTIRLLPPTTLMIETLHAGLFDPEDDEGILGPTFSVSPDDTIVQVEVTNLIRDNDTNDQLFLMIESRGAEQPRGAEGDRFFTRETNDPPQLIVFF